MIPDAVVDHLPHHDGRGCQAIGIVPEDRRQGISAPPPEGFHLPGRQQVRRASRVWTLAGLLAAAGATLGFREGWYREVVEAVGTYGDLWARDLGDASDLKLAPGPNQPWPAGVMVVPAMP